MTMNRSMKNQCKVALGTVIVGKWHKNTYTVIQELGFGANGIVYLANCRDGLVALKMSDYALSITAEVNVLKSFAKVQGTTLGPSLLDVDDWERSGAEKISFYVMEYIKGLDLLTFISQRGQSWVPVLILQLLTDLENLHQNGWVFGDLKPENLMIMGPPPKIRCIDVGGTTMQGRAIKEYTEFYDRGYWGLGSRKAEPSYDLFAVAMIVINTAYPKRFNKTDDGLTQLRGRIRENTHLQKYESVLVRALQGRYQSASTMRRDLLKIISPKPHHDQTAQTRSARNAKQTTSHVAPTQAQTNKTIRKQTTTVKKKRGKWIETLLLTGIVTVLYITYIISKLI